MERTFQLATNLLHSLWDFSPAIARDLMHRSSLKRFSIQPRDSHHLSRRQLVSLTWRYSYYLYLVLGILRIALASVILNAGLADTDFGRAFFEIDVTNRVCIYLTKIANGPSLMCSIPFPIFVIVIDYLINGKRYNYIWRLTHDLVALNTDHFFKLNRSLCFRFDAARPVESLKHNLNVIKWFSNPPKKLGKIHFYVRKLKFSPEKLSKRVRIKVLALSMIVQANLAIMMAFIVNLGAVAVVYYYCFLLMPNARVFLGHLVVLADVIYIFYATTNTLKLFSFCTHSFATIVYMYHQQNGRLTRMLKQTMSLLAENKLTSRHFARIIDFFTRQQSAECFNLQHANSQIISPLIFACAISNFGSNIYLTSALLYFDFLTTADRALFGGLMVLQFTVFVITFAPMIKQVDNLYSFSTYLYKSQLSLEGTRQLVAAKLRLMRHIETICSNTEFTYTVGPLAKITRQSLFEFVLLWSAYILYILGFLFDVKKSNK